MSWLAHVTGFDGGAFASLYGGILGDVGELGLIAAGVGWYTHRKCQACHRIGRYVVEGTPYKTCHKHLTDGHHSRLHEHHRLNFPEQHAMLQRIEQTQPIE